MRPLLLFLFFSGICVGKTAIPVLTLNGTVNPGTQDYLVSGIQQAQTNGAPFVVIEMDTPGGLLNSTRQIVQAMLNASLPIVVFISPKGAHAGSAGAIITFAADVAVMAPGTQIGAAHPVTTGEKDSLSKEMSEKITNDTAAFAESLAKNHSRNTEWARKAVTESASIIAEEALKLDVVDEIQEDLPALLKSLSGKNLRVPKAGKTALPKDEFEINRIPMALKHQVVSFFADPNLAYLIMSLGGLCIWVELTHPGLILPGVIGALCILLSLVSFQLLPISYGAFALILVGLAMLISEVFLPTYGVLAIGGLISFIIGSLYLMDSQSPEFQLTLQLILPVAAILTAGVGVLTYLVAKSRQTPKRSGLDALIGQFAEVRESHPTGELKILIQGEIWNAKLTASKTLPLGSLVKLISREGMTFTVQEKESLPC